MESIMFMDQETYKGVYKGSHPGTPMLCIFYYNKNLKEKRYVDNYIK